MKNTNINAKNKVFLDTITEKIKILTTLLKKYLHVRVGVTAALCQKTFTIHSN